MASKGNVNTAASYLSPTESSARKNVNVEPFYDDSNFTAMTTDHEHTPQKNVSRVVTSNKIKSYIGSGAKESDNDGIMVHKLTTFERSAERSIGKKRIRGGVVETTKFTTTTYSPDAKKTQIIHDHCTHRRKNC